MCLGFLEDLGQVVNNPAKKWAIDKLAAALWKLHRYFDRRLDRFESYEDAERAIRLWGKLMG